MSVTWEDKPETTSEILADVWSAYRTEILTLAGIACALAAVVIYVMHHVHVTVAWR